MSATYDQGDLEYLKSLRSAEREEARQQAILECKNENEKTTVFWATITGISGVVAGVVAGVLLAKFVTIPGWSFRYAAFVFVGIAFLAVTIAPCWRLFEEHGLNLKFRPLWTDFGTVHSVQAMPRIAWDVMAVIYAGIAVLAALVVWRPRRP